MDENKVIKSVPFDGKKENFRIWSSKFLSYCTFKDCANVLLKDYNKTMPDDSTILAKPAASVADPDPAMIAYKLQKAKTMAYALLTMCMSENISFMAVERAKTSHLKNGSARLAWVNLEAIYKATSESNKYELEKKFNQSELKNEHTNPDEWFGELESMRVQLLLDFQIDITEKALKTHIIYNIRPRMYMTAISILKSEMTNSGTPLELESIKREIREVYEANISRSPRDRKETMLVTQSGPRKFPPNGPRKFNKFSKRFKGDCRICGKKGHKAG